MITDSFAGSPPTGHVSITAEIFLSLIPSTILPRSINNIGEYLTSGYLKCSHALSSSIKLYEYSEHTGDQFCQSVTGETGGTDAKLNNVCDISSKFFEGEILQAVLFKFRNFLSNSFDENLFITGIISVLSAFSKEIGSFSTVHNFLLEPQTSNKDNFLTLIKLLSLEIDNIISNDQNIDEKIAFALNELGLDKSNDSFYGQVTSRIKSRKSRSTFIEKRTDLEAIIIFREFLKEMASILVFKEILDDMAVRAKADDEENI